MATSKLHAPTGMHRRHTINPALTTFIVLYLLLLVAFFWAW
ncbi:MAG: hypothetical protein QNJ07_02270 [Woeseiaceae bacterium]|nr:hypothetical protein [Woeseiaceae bacterium]